MIDFVSPPRSARISLVSGRGHYDAVIDAVRSARLSVWIATANVKELRVEPSTGAAAPSHRQRDSYVSVLSVLSDLAARGVELRLLHAALPSRAFRAAFDRYPRLVRGGLAIRQCPRVHLKAVIVDGTTMYLGSANWTGAGLGAKGSNRRNFELGIITQDLALLDQVQALYDRIWSGTACAECGRRDQCEDPLDHP